MRNAELIADSEPVPMARAGWPRRRHWLVGLGAVVLLVVGGLIALQWGPDRVARQQAKEWLADFQALRERSVELPFPTQGLTPAVQQVLIDDLVRPESRVARWWSQICRALPPAVGQRLPRLPLARDQVIRLSRTFIEMPPTLFLRQRLLEAALRPNASNRMYAVQFATFGWPLPIEIFPQLEQLAASPETNVRLRVALALHGYPMGTPGVDALLAKLESDPMTVVREASRYSYRSDEKGELVRIPSPHASRP